MTKNSRIILLDVGGTFVKSALGISGKGAVGGTFASTPIASDGSAEEIEEAFREAVGVQARRAAEEGYAIEAVCAAIPGPFDYHSGTFLMKHKFASVYGKTFREILADVIDPDTRLGFVHDVNGALLGALTLHPELSEGNVALSTFGTGLGFAYSKDGEVQEDENGSPAVKIWNMPYRDGILEDYASRRAILRFYSERGGQLAEGEDVKEIAAKARKGDAAACEAFEEAAVHYVDGAGSVISRLGIRHILFGGQISKSFDLMEATIKSGLGEGIGISVLEDIQGTVLAGAASLTETN